MTVALAWGGGAGLLRLSGFDILSDDDDARVLLAQGFAERPSLDPSRTSWLPFPFWVMGLAMKALGGTLGVARGVAVAQATVAGWLVLAAAREVGLARQSAVFASLLPLFSAVVPLLGAAPTPELLGAALALYGVVGATGARPWLAGLALSAATLSRYETWAPALATAGVLALRAWAAETRRERVASLVGCGLALFGPVAWTLWNAHLHGDAFHYAKRVAAYQAGLGASLSGTTYLVALVRFAPVVVLGFALGIALLGKRGASRTWTLLLAVGSVVLGLLVSAARGGAPTHHPERALCLAWMASAIGFTATLPDALIKGSRLRTLFFVLGTVGLSIAARRLVARDFEALPTRVDERALGRALAAALPAGERVLIAPTSYAHLATLTAFARPFDAVVVSRRSFDPRAASDDDPTTDPDALRRACRERNARFALLASVPALAHVSAYPESWVLPGAVLVRVQ